VGLLKLVGLSRYQVNGFNGFAVAGRAEVGVTSAMLDRGGAWPERGWGRRRQPLWQWSKRQWFMAGGSSSQMLLGISRLKPRYHRPAKWDPLLNATAVMDIW